MLRNKRSNKACRRASRRARPRSNAWKEVSDDEDVSSLLDDLSEDEFNTSDLDDSSETSSEFGGRRRRVKLVLRTNRRIVRRNRPIRNDPDEPGPSNASSSSGNSRSGMRNGAGKRKHKAKSPRALDSESSSDDMFSTNGHASKIKRPRRTELVTDEDSESSTNLPASTQRHCVIQSSSDDSVDSLNIRGQRQRRHLTRTNSFNNSDSSTNEDFIESRGNVSPVLMVNRRPAVNGRRYENTIYLTLNATNTSSSSSSSLSSTSSLFSTSSSSSSFSSTSSSSSSSTSSSSSSSTSSLSSMSSNSASSYETESLHYVSARSNGSTSEQQILSSDSDSSDSEGDKCAICLKKLRNQRLGNPSDCDHNFCFTCLMEWSKTSTTCPVDRSPFDAIIVRDEPNGNMIERIEVQAKVFGGLSGEEEAFTETISCEICGSGDDESELLLCDMCNNGYHMGCLRPPLVQIPDGSWVCPSCRGSNRDGVSRNSGGLTERLMEFMQDLPMSISSRRSIRNRMRNTRMRLVGPPPRGRGPTLTRTRNHTATNFSMETVASLLEERMVEVNTTPTLQATSPIVQKPKNRRSRAQRQFSRSQPRNVTQEIANKIRPNRRGDPIFSSSIDRNSNTIVETIFPSFNLFEDDMVLFPGDDDGEDEDVLAGEVATMTRARSEFSARRMENRKNIVSSLVSSAHRRRIRPMTPPRINEVESSGVNLLDSILESQMLWHSKNVEITSTKDGKLNVKLKQDEENKPDLKNSNHQSKEIPLFPGGSKNGSNSSSPSDGNKSYANNSRYSELSGGGGGGGSRGGNNSFGFSGGSLNSLNPSTRPGFSNILGNNNPSAVDLSPFRGAAPIRFRMNPPRPALRRPNFNASLSRHPTSSSPAAPLNSSSTTTQSPRKTNTAASDGGADNEEDVDLYDDIESETVVEADKPEMFASLEPPPEPPALLMDSGSSSDEDNGGWVIDDANNGSVANKSNIYDPTEPNEDSDVENDSVDENNANIAPGYLRSPSYGGLSEFGPHLPLPKPPALPIELESANNSEEEDEAECPNMTLYSSTSINLANNVQDIPVPESRPDDLDCIPIPPVCEPTEKFETKTSGLYSPTAKDDDSKSESDVQSVQSESTKQARRSSSDESASSSEEQSISNDSDDEERLRRRKSKMKRKKPKDEVIEPITYYGESSDESDENDSESKMVAVSSTVEELQPVTVSEERELTVDLTELSDKLREDEEEELKNENEESEVTVMMVEEKEDEAQIIEEEEEEEKEKETEEKRDEENDNAARIARIVDEVRNSMEESGALVKHNNVDNMAEQTEPNASTACLLPSDDLDPVSDVEDNDFVDYRKQSKDRKKKRKKTRRRTEVSPGRTKDLEEGEIEDEQKKRQRSPLRKRRRSQSPSVSTVGGEKKQKRKRDRKEKGDKENKEQDFQWKKLSKSTKERNYRAGKSKPDGRRRDRNLKEKRKEIERYDVRKMLSDKPRRDKFGRDLSMGRSPRTRSRSQTPRTRTRSRSPSAGAKSYTDHHRRESKSNTFRRSFSQEDRWIDWSPVWTQRRSRSRTRRTRSRSRSRQRARLSGDRYRNRSKNQDHGGRKRRRSVSLTLDRYSPVPALTTTKKRRHSRGDQGRKSATSYAAPAPTTEYLYERSWSRTMSYASPTPEPEAYPYERSPSIEPTRLPSAVSVERDIIAPNPQNLTVIVPNVDAGKKKHKKKKDGKKKKKKQPSKEVFTSGDNIVVSVNFDDNQKTISAKSSKRKRTTAVVGVGQVEETATVVSRKKRKDDSARKKRKQTLQVSEEVLNAKPVAVIDLNSSPCKEMSPTEVISLTDSGDEENTTAAPSKDNTSRSRPITQQSGTTVELHRSYVMTSAGPKTPPEPPIKFTVTSGPMRSLPTNPIFEQDEELDNGEDVSVTHYNKGPNTPPEPLGSGIQNRRTLSPNATMYDPFEPTKSRSASPEGVRAANDLSKSDHVDMFADDGDKSNDNQNVSTVASGEHESGDAANTNDKIVDLDQDDVTSSPKTSNVDENSTKISPNKETVASDVAASSNNIDSVQQANVVLDLTSLGDEFVPKSSIPLVKTSQGKYEFQGGKIPDKPITVVIAQQSTPVKPQPQQVMVTPTRQIPAKTIEPIKQPMFPDILPWKLPPQTSSYSTPPSTVTPQQKSTPAGATQNGSQDDTSFELDDSPYSPASSEGDDLFEPPPLNTSAPSPLAARGLPLPPVNSYKSRVDALFSSSPAKKLRSTTHPSRTIGTHKPMAKKITKTIAHNKKDIGGKADEEQLRILDDVPNSAVEMIVKEKFLKKLHRQERVNEEVKVALKPHYAKKHITKEEYKDIMRKAVPKICHNKSGDINPSKIQSLVEAYVKKVRHSKRKGSTLPGSTGPPLFPNMAAAKSVKKQKSLWG